MKATDFFKETIKAYLDKRASEDAQFAEKYASEDKNLDDCCTYILNWVQKSGSNGFADEEIFGQAVHYYDESDIEVGAQVNCNVVVNHTVELTDEEIAQAKEAALAKVREEAIKEAKVTPIAKRPKQVKATTSTKEENGLLYPSLF